MRLANRVQIDESALADFRRHLREASEGDKRGRIRDLRGLVQKHGRIFKAENFSTRSLSSRPPTQMRAPFSSSK